MKKLSLLFTVFLFIITLSVPAHAEVLYSTFGTGQSFDNSEISGWLVGSGYSYNQQIAAPFILSFDAIFDSIDFAADYDLGPNQLTVNLVYDDSGLPSTDPGKVIESFNFTNLSQEPKIYTGNSFLNPLLKGSTQYWVVLKTDNSTTQIQWKWNNIGTTGLAYCNPPVGNPWIYYKGKTPAFDIKGSAAVPDTFEVYIDIKPGSCPNPLNVKSKGVLPVAVLGTEDFDVSTIDPATIQLSLEGMEVGVAPLRWSYEDVGTPFEGELCGCHDLNGDGYIDLSLKFDTKAFVTILELEEVTENTLPLTLTGNLKEEFGGNPIKGQDCIRILNKAK